MSISSVRQNCYIVTFAFIYTQLLTFVSITLVCLTCHVNNIMPFINQVLFSPRKHNTFKKQNQFIKLPSFYKMPINTTNLICRFHDLICRFHATICLFTNFINAFVSHLFRFSWKLKWKTIIINRVSCFLSKLVVLCYDAYSIKR